MVYECFNNSFIDELGIPHLSLPPITFDVRPVVRTHFLGRYFNACNAIDNQNIIRQYYLAVDKYWVTQSGYFRLATTVALGVGITYGKILYCNGVAEGNVDRKISTSD